MTKFWKNSIRFVIFLSIGLLLFYLVYKGINIKEFKNSLLNAKWQWLAMSMFLGLTSHFSRAARWKLMLEPLGYNPRTKTLFYSVMIMYLSNNAIPRSGELIRTGMVNKYENIPFSTLLGTVVTERAVDFIMLFLLTAIVVITQFPVISKFSEIHNINTIKISHLLIIAFLAMILLISVIFIFRSKILKSKFYKKIEQTVKNFIAGLIAVKNVKNLPLFLFLTIYIWAMYFMMIYVVFFAFDFTKDLPAIAGLTTFVIASYGMVIPVPGGIGTWHYLAYESLNLYGINIQNGKIFAFAAHESQLIMLVFFGLLSLFLTSFLTKNDSNIKTISNEN